MASKNIITTIVGIIAVVLIVSGIIYPDHTGYFSINLFRQTHFETKNFIIDVPKFHWVGNDRQDNVSILFVGLPMTIEGLEKKISPMIDLHKLNDVGISIRLESLGMFCDESFEKTMQKINDWEAEVYICTTKSKADLMIRHIMYKDEAFHMFYYVQDKNVFENFQKQYDKFFEGVRLKE
jgi:hypothetical protein